MRLHSYIVEHDHGFAPNPFHGICTLATCKPRIRRYAVEGDYVIGTGSKKRGLQGRLVYAMRIGQIVTFDQYWSDPTFGHKKPVMNGSFVQRYGDNIYRHDPGSGVWLQADSFHSLENGIPDSANLETDTSSTENVLIADWFVYFGGRAPVIPAAHNNVVQTTQGHRSEDDPDVIEAFLTWVKSLGEEGLVGDPYEWRFLKLAS